MYQHVWTEWDSATRLLAAPEALVLQSLPIGPRLVVVARGEAAFGAFDLHQSGSVKTEHWTADPALARVTDLTQLCEDSGVSVATGRLDTIVQPTFGQTPLPVVKTDIRHLGITPGNAGVALYGSDIDGVSRRKTMADTGDLPLGDVVDTETLVLGNRTFGFAASARDAGIVSFRLLPDDLRVRDVERPDGTFTPYRLSDLDTIAHGRTGFLLAAASGSGTLSLFEVNKKGKLALKDTVSDQLWGISEVASLIIGERVIVATAGSFGAVSLYEISHRSTLRPVFDITARDTDQPFSDVSDLLFDSVGDDPFLFVADRRADAVSAFKIEIPDAPNLRVGGKKGELLKGSSGADVLDGRGGHDKIRGRDGDDTLYDGRGKDILWGGNGADVFVFDADTVRDRIRDFELGLDRIDLSQFPRVSGLINLSIESKPWGALIHVNGEVIRVDSHDKTPLLAEDFTADDFIF
jgi:hypothetical protein